MLCYTANLQTPMHPQFKTHCKYQVSNGIAQIREGVDVVSNADTVWAAALRLAHEKCEVK